MNILYGEQSRAATCWQDIGQCGSVLLTLHSQFSISCPMICEDRFLFLHLFAFTASKCQIRAWEPLF
jgi:hypothetical protein